ncbi:M3 family metallopeptidase [Bacteroides propionicifaciens]|uniref:M3 family metallopeptidase n=1 Tax=Bacteroides propionicifaciens TaxID=392838 RepID=UPI00039A03C3|nr:M3 family metallopeptidase [Bacteroides propionicifaciens]
MKKISLLLTLCCLMNISCSQKNPFFEKYNTPHATVPFDKIKNEHYKPAIQEGIKQQTAEVDAITSNPEAPTFENTILAYEKSGDLLSRTLTVFFNLRSAETNDELQVIAQEVMPQLSEHSNNISLNQALFERVKVVYDQKESANLNPEQLVLLDKVYDSFIRSGANLKGAQKEKYRELTQKLSQLGLTYGENNLKETNNYQLVISDESKLAGLPESAIEAAKETATEKGVEGWVFTLDAPSYIPLLRYAEDRDLRKELYLAYNTKCTHDNEYNNLEVVKEIVNTEMAIAQLLGYKSYADFTLEKRMAENSDNVYKLLNDLIEAYKPTALKEVAEVEALAKITQGADFTLMPWDWSFYSEKLKNQKFNFDEEQLRPYFELENVKKGVFGLATQLYGVTFKENKDIPVYHADVHAYDVFDKDGSFLAVLYTDFHPRAGKRAGAWMTSYKDQWIDEATGENSRPHISIVMNFTKPTANKPALLTFDEVNTFLHEFGHALHGIFADTTYESLSGTSVYRDFVELPSQLMENFLTEKDYLNTFAKHYETGEVLPDSMVQKIVDAANFNVGYGCMRQVSFGLLDMAWYTQEEPFEGDVIDFEQKAWGEAQVLPVIDNACMSTQFGHIFAGGYAAGYYSYKWAEVLDADAYAAFQENGIFDTATANLFRTEILSKGGTKHPMILYKNFRGQEPSIDALLKRNGISK